MQAITKTEQLDLQRARGTIDLVIKNGKLERFYQSGSAKIFMPKTYARTIEAVLVNTGGGLTGGDEFGVKLGCLLYTSPSPRDATLSRMPSSA